MLLYLLKSTCFRYLSETLIMSIMLCVVVVLVEHISVNSHLLAGWVSLTRWLIETQRNNFFNTLLRLPSLNVPLTVEWDTTKTWLIFNWHMTGIQQEGLEWYSTDTLLMLSKTLDKLISYLQCYSTDPWLIFNWQLADVQPKLDWIQLRLDWYSWYSADT